MTFGEFEDDDSEFRYEGSLPVLAGSFRRKIIGYFNGDIPVGMRTRREIRLVKLPELTWVYGFLMRAKEIGPALYVRDGAQMEGVEGFHPIRSASQIRQSSATDNSIDIPSASTETAIESDEDFEALLDIDFPSEIADQSPEK